MTRIILLIIIAMLAAQGVAEDLQQAGEKLDDAIDDVIQQREYQWRMPREVVDEQEQNLLFDFLEGTASTIRRAWQPVAKVWNKLRDWLRRALSSLGPSGTGREWSPGELNLVIIVLITSIALLVLFFIWRNRRRKRSREEPVQAEAIVPLPDLTDENLVADQLPLEGWQKLAQDLLSRGELRLALRAFFMATLAQLADSHLISVAKFKSNRDYVIELQRRAYENKQVQHAFYENVVTVDSVWYGKHPVTQEVLETFLTNADTLRRGSA